MLLNKLIKYFTDKPKLAKLMSDVHRALCRDRLCCKLCSSVPASPDCKFIFLYRWEPKPRCSQSCMWWWGIGIGRLSLASGVFWKKMGTTGQMNKIYVRIFPLWNLTTLQIAEKMSIHIVYATFLIHYPEDLNKANKQNV